VNWFNVLAITPGPFFKSNQSELWQWTWDISDFQLPIAILSNSITDCAAIPSNAKQLAIGN
jgi:hypothetical protein